MLLENRIGRDKNLMLQDGGGNGNPNGGDGGRPTHRVVKQKKRSGKTPSGLDKAKVHEESDSDMSDHEFQIVIFGSVHRGLPFFTEVRAPRQN